MKVPVKKHHPRGIEEDWATHEDYGIRLKARQLAEIRALNSKMEAANKNPEPELQETVQYKKARDFAKEEREKKNPATPGGEYE